MQNLNDGMVYSPATRTGFAVQQIGTGHVSDFKLHSADRVNELEQKVANRDLHISAPNFHEKCTKDLRKGDRVHKVPLTASFERDDVEIEAYHLEGEGLEVDVMNYHPTGSAVSPSAFGVYASVVVRDVDRKEAFERVNAIITTLREFYRGEEGL